MARIFWSKQQRTGSERRSVTDKEDQEATADIDTIARQLDHQLKKVLGVRD